VHLAPIRPRFRAALTGDLEDVVARVASSIDPETPCVVRTLGHHIDINGPPDERRRWSPYVHLEFMEEGDGEVLVLGLIGPQPATWTLYAFALVHVLLIVGFALVYGLVQVSLEMTPWALWVALGSLVPLVGLYVGSQVGRRLAREQTAMLMGLVEGAIGPVEG